MLSDKGIRDGMSNNEIVVEPFEENCLTPVGYDLRIGLKAFSWKKHQKIDINSKNPLEIEAGDTVIIETLESITLSKKISGTLHAMATHSLRRGLSQISTTVDPGWTGKLLISIHNYRDSCVELQFRETFCTLCLYQAVPEAQKDVCRPAGRSDIWAELDDRAKQERAQLEAKNASEGRKQLAAERKRRLYVAFIFLLILFSGVAASRFLEPETGVIITTAMAAAAVLIPEMLKQK